MSHLIIDGLTTNLLNGSPGVLESILRIPGGGCCRWPLRAAKEGHEATIHTVQRCTAVPQVCRDRVHREARGDREWLESLMRFSPSGTSAPPSPYRSTTLCGWPVSASRLHRVVTTRSERVAPPYPPQCLGAASDETVLGDGLVGVAGARRLKPARSPRPARMLLPSFDLAQYEGARAHTESTSRVRSRTIGSAPSVRLWKKAQY